MNTTRHRLLIVAGFGAMLAAAAFAVRPAVSDDRLARAPDDSWERRGAVSFPERFQAPRQFTALRLNAPRLASALAQAPRETFGRIPPQAQTWLPLPDGRFTQVSLARSQLMEAGLAARYPQIETFVFSGADGLSGHLVRYGDGVRITAQLGMKLLRIEPAETDDGQVYLSYFDAERTDGANLILHAHDMHEHEHAPPGPRAARSLGAMGLQAQANDISAGPEMRIYRMAASTTGEFYQARDGGNGNADVIASIVNDLAGANAVFEPEVSVRLILAEVSEDVLYSDAGTDPFDNTASACSLRDANRDNMKAELNDADYDLGFLFATKPGGGANGCAWFVVCDTSSDTLHKARGAGLMGNNGSNSASGLLAHETGHQLGARHTFTGQAGACTLIEFQAGDSESGYEPGSGTTRMSYNGNCDSDDVDVDTSGGALPAGSYFHSRSFDEIVDNVFNGTGATCGTLVATGNQPPTVNAGADYTIPRQTPFTLSGSASDDEPLSFVWEQFDRAETQRPINTDPGDGPIVRSIPPSADSTRTVPNLQDLLDNITRAGEILPQIDRELNFRLVARDNLMGGGGVAYDSMKITVQGDPFFITSPNSGSFEAGCSVPLAWQVGGGSIAPQVQALFSSDGGLSFATPLTGPIANDGAHSIAMPCAVGNDARLKLQAVGNIFFDVNDENLTVVNTPPSAEINAAGGAVDANCQFTVQFSGTASDSCGLAANNVTLQFIKGTQNFTLGTPAVNVQQLSANEVSVSGSVVVSNLSSSPAQLSLQLQATDACGGVGAANAPVAVVDETPPTIDVSLSPTQLWPPNHKMVPIQATVVAADNCPGVSPVLTSLVSSEPDNGVADGDTANDIQGADIGTPDLHFSLRAERAGSGPGRDYTALYTATDGSNNQAQDSAVVKVPKSR